ncbi:MAG: nucleoside phosphorylase [Thermodesulfovibrionales bacterium]|nr:nucleoside phosphorylase [Thermodesulfovibrionales bacterium]
MKNDISFKASDLPIINGRVYHLDLKPADLARDIIIVGDPERVPFIADEFLDNKEVDRFHRGLRTITGRVKETGQRVSIIASGMGTPSLEIVLNEIVALNEIDFHARTRKSEYDMITIIRVGTSGGIQQNTELGTLIITDYAIGLDNTGLFYDAPYQNEKCKRLEDRIREEIDGVIPCDSRFKGKIFPYASKANQDVVKALKREAQNIGVKYKRGITVSNSGFFANQGRALSRVPLTVPDIDSILASVDTGIEGIKIENMEMEASFLLHFMGALGYRAGVVCPVIDNRRKGEFIPQYTQYVRDAAEIALRTLYALR